MGVGQSTEYLSANGRELFQELDRLKQGDYINNYKGYLEDIILVINRGVGLVPGIELQQAIIDYLPTDLYINLDTRLVDDGSNRDRLDLLQQYVATKYIPYMENVEKWEIAREYVEHRVPDPFLTSEILSYTVPPLPPMLRIRRHNPQNWFWERSRRYLSRSDLQRQIRPTRRSRRIAEAARHTRSINN